MKTLPTTNVITKKYHHCLENFIYTHKGYFFSKDTMRFFNSKVYSCLYEDRFFITSEKQSYNHDRTYSIRLLCPSDSIETIGNFQEFKTKKQAENFIRKYLSKEIADIINLVRLHVNTNKYKKNVQSYINKNQEAFNSIVDLGLMDDYFNRYLNEFKTKLKGSK